MATIPAYSHFGLLKIQQKSVLCNYKSVYHREHSLDYQAKLQTKIPYPFPKQFKYSPEKSSPEPVVSGGTAVILL
jgi:hypothetical protein